MGIEVIKDVTFVVISMELDSLLPVSVMTIIIENMINKELGEMAKITDISIRKTKTFISL